MAKANRKALPAETEPRAMGSMLLEIADQLSAARHQADNLSEFAVDVVMSDRDSSERERALAAVQLFAKDVADRIKKIETAVERVREAA